MNDLDGKSARGGKTPNHAEGVDDQLFEKLYRKKDEYEAKKK